MIIEFIRNRPFLKKIVYKIGRNRALEIYSQIKSFLEPGEMFLDVGSGICINTQVLIERGFKVVPLDIKNISFVKGITPVIYDGRNFPFKDNSFDVVLVLYMLHHVHNPELILEEARRVSKNKIIVMEDINNGFFQ